MLKCPQKGESVDERLQEPHEHGVVDAKPSGFLVFASRPWVRTGSDVIGAAGGRIGIGECWLVRRFLSVWDISSSFRLGSLRQWHVATYTLHRWYDPGFDIHPRNAEGVIRYPMPLAEAD